MVTVSVTDRQTYKRCRRKWDYSSNIRRNLTKYGASGEALELGGIVHRALAKWILDPKAKLEHIFLSEASSRHQEIILKHVKEKGVEPDPELLAPMLDVVTLGQAMMRNYQEYHKKPIPDNMTFAAAEQEVVIQVPGTQYPCEGCITFNLSVGINTIVDQNTQVVNPFLKCPECNGTGFLYHHLSMTLDGLLQDDKGHLYVLEHKTYSSKPHMVELNMADQFTGYAWGVREAGLGTVRGIAYDGMWKRAAPPRGKNAHDLFFRTRILKSNEELDQWGANLAQELLEIGDGPAIYPNIPWQGCLYDCSFIDLCQAQNRGEDISELLAKNYTQRETIRGGGVRNAE